MQTRNSLMAILPLASCLYSLLALVHFSLLHPVCEVLSHFTSLNPFISFKIRFQHPVNAVSYLLSFPFPHCLVGVSSLRRSLSFYPNLLYILHTVFLFLRLSLSDSADVPFPHSIICCTSCYSFANPLACPSFVLGLLVHAN